MPVSPLTEAAGSVGAADEAAGAGAHVAAHGVGAVAAVAHPGDGPALIHVCKGDNPTGRMQNVPFPIHTQGTEGGKWSWGGSWGA